MHHHSKILCLTLALVATACDTGLEPTPLEDGSYSTDAFLLYEGEDLQSGQWITKTADGNYLVLGEAEFRETRLLKIDEQGGKIWSRTIYGTGSEIHQTRDSGFIIAGTRGDFGRGDEICLVKTNKWGDEMWSATFGGPERDVGGSVVQTFDGGYLVAGRSESFSTGYGSAIYVIRIDPDGEELWSKSFAGDKDSSPSAIVETEPGRYVLAGSMSGFLLDQIILLINIDDEGNELWSQMYDQGTLFDRGCSLIQPFEGGLLIAGSFYSGSSDNFSDVELIRTDDSGQMLWARSYGGRSIEGVYQVRQLSDGGFAFLGTTHSFGNGRSDIYLVRTDGQGRKLWAKSYGGPDFDGGHSLEETSQGGFFITGYTESKGSGKLENLFLLKTDADGTPVR
jgi:hypothetical protein